LQAIEKWEYGGDPKAKERPFASSRVARYKPDAQGNPGKPEFLSDPIPKRIRNLAVDDATGVIYVSTWAAN
jgi:hypothetical protein